MRVAVLLTAYALAAVASPAPAQEAEQTGRIRMCRPAGIVGTEDRKPLHVPAGSGFAAAFNERTGANMANYGLKTTEDATIPPKPGCATVAAMLDHNPSNERVSKDIPLIQAFSTPGADVVARVVSGFGTRPVKK